MTMIRTTGQEDCTWLFNQISNKGMHYKWKSCPYLAFLVDNDGNVTVRILLTTADVLSLPSDTQIMKSTGSQWNSNYHQFIVGQLRSKLEVLFIAKREYLLTCKIMITLGAGGKLYGAHYHSGPNTPIGSPIICTDDNVWEIVQACNINNATIVQNLRSGHEEKISYGDWKSVYGRLSRR